MAINVSQAFHRTSANPIDDSQALTKAEMLTVNDNLMPSKYFTICQDDGQIYLYDKSNTADPTTGKFRLFEGGSSYTADEGVHIDGSNITTDKSSSGDIDEIVDVLPNGNSFTARPFTPLGTVISFFGETAPKFFLVCDGSTYNKSDYPELANHLLSLTTHSQYEVSGDDTKFKVPDLRGEFLRGTGTNGHSGQGSGVDVGVHQDATRQKNIVIDTTNNQNYFIMNKAGSGGINAVDNFDTRPTDSTSLGQNYLTMQVSTTKTIPDNYTSRPTNTSVLYCIAYKDIYSNPMNEYSTDEKVVGTWIDGKPIYQRTFVDTAPTTTTDGTLVEKYISMGTSIDKVISIKSVRESSGYAWGEFPLTNPASITTDTISSKTVVTSVKNLMMMAFVFDNDATSNANKIRVTNNCVAWSDIPIYITIQYTKTTD